VLTAIKIRKREEVYIAMWREQAFKRFVAPHGLKNMKGRMTMRMTLLRAAVLVFVGVGVLAPGTARAHCDTMDGPVVMDAKKALEAKDVTAVLKWVNEPSEAEIKSAFDRTLAVRAKGAEAKSLADQFFFETLVRVHRAGEGAPYTGLKPAGAELNEGVKLADAALETGDVKPVLKAIDVSVAEGINKRFAEVREKRSHADHNVAAGREFVKAYVGYVHYVEGLQKASEGPDAHGTKHEDPALAHADPQHSTKAPAEQHRH
jgi:hypothetical protein